MINRAASIAVATWEGLVSRIKHALGAHDWTLAEFGTWRCVQCGRRE